MTDQEADLNGNGGGEELLDKSNSEMPVIEYSQQEKVSQDNKNPDQVSLHAQGDFECKTFLNHQKEKQNSLLKARVKALKKSVIHLSMN